MTLSSRIKELNTAPRNPENTEEYTSEFQEWFYQNMYKERGFDTYPILYSVSLEPEYEMMRELCRILIHQKFIQYLSLQTLASLCEDLKVWTIKSLKKWE